jgi:hypothetical protein
MVKHEFTRNDKAYMNDILSKRLQTDIWTRWKDEVNIPQFNGAVELE